MRQAELIALDGRHANLMRDDAIAWFSLVKDTASLGFERLAHVHAEKRNGSHADSEVASFSGSLFCSALLHPNSTAILDFWMAVALVSFTLRGKELPVGRGLIQPGATTAGWRPAFAWIASGD